MTTENPAPTPWVQTGLLSLNGRTEVGICRVELDRDAGLFRATKLTSEPPAITYFGRNALFRLDLMSEEEVQREVDVARELLAKKRRDAERARRAQAERVEQLRTQARDLRLERIDDQVRVCWDGDVPEATVAQTLNAHLERFPERNHFYRGGEVRVVSCSWLSRAADAALVAFVRELGGQAEPLTCATDESDDDGDEADIDF